MKELKPPKGYIKVTPTQLRAICTAADNISSYIGCGDEEADEESKWIVKHIDRLLNANGYKRLYK
ncbi:hypothetical protein WBJ53_14930 [Spirosoma sp. SC4-14]|uniref:hypothetical protein n=1 Tax=Spirosoma sp. SC4-14 TaxID=3128900 RepID=UPI0030D464F7